MSCFSKVTDKEMLNLRNKIFLNYGLPALNKKGFVKSPFSTDWFGRNNLKDFNYYFCRVNEHSQLERVEVYIARGEKWVKIFLNIFELQPRVHSIEQLDGLDSLRFVLIPNSVTQMQFGVDDTKGLYLFHIMFGEKLKIGSYYSKNGLDRRAEELGKLIEKDLLNIDYFIKRWHEMHKPLVTDWNGHAITTQSNSDSDNY